MTDDPESRGDEVIQRVVQKLTAHKPTLGRSRHGQVSWRRLPNGTVEIDLKPTL